MPSVITAVLCAALLKVCVVSSTPKAAIYIDNGYDQTAIDRLMTQAEKKEMELEILNLLGLPNRPRKIIRSPLKKSAPRFLLDIYRSLMEDENDENNRAKRSADLSFSGEEQQQIDQSDVIMTFESIGHHVSSVRHERGKRLWFNTSEMPVAEDIVGAELKIFKNADESAKSPDARYTVTVYQLINTDNGERELEYVSALNTSAAFSGWLGLNLTACLATWVAFPDSNKGLYLSVHPVDRPGHEIRPEDIGLVTVKAQDEIQPFMVAFLKASNHVKARATRDTKTRIKKSTPLPNIANEYKSNDPEGRRSCRIQTLYISFKDLQWQDWIIAPDGYAAYYCAGECNFPLNAHMNATNHAIVQTLVHLMNPWRYPKPCCAPTKLNPISVLFFLDDQNVILKKYKKMVVKSCGCH
ncbi:protein 60A-like [Anoplophora glabripennis]|uniref:protein 60A-like n=1 Tax=Anoplophora glabripennis TaxID=217634 RepID=UPI000873D7AB|nr:protein 60A-like [Anoplophora glabripennis]